MGAGSVASSGHRGGRLGSGERPTYDTPRWDASQAQNTRCSGCSRGVTATCCGFGAFGARGGSWPIAVCGADCGRPGPACGEVPAGRGRAVDNRRRRPLRAGASRHDIEHPCGLVSAEVTGDRRPASLGPWTTSASEPPSDCSAAAVAGARRTSAGSAGGPGCRVAARARHPRNAVTIGALPVGLALAVDSAGRPRPSVAGRRGRSDARPAHSLLHESFAGTCAICRDGRSGPRSRTRSMASVASSTCSRGTRPGRWCSSSSSRPSWWT